MRRPKNQQNEPKTAIPRPLAAAAAVLAWLFSSAFAQAQDTPDYFRQNCMNCHTIGGGRLTGPDLKDVTKRQTRDWLANFLTNPKAVLDSGDPYAQKIFEESRRVPMPMAPGMTRERAEKLLDLIEAESKLPESQFKGLQISTAPFTAADVQAGRDIFTGRQRLASGGTACIACHSIHDIAALGGGLLGPDLTNVYDRLKGRASLSAWLVAPGTETMQPAFRNHPLKAEEIHSLVAYFEDAARYRPADPTGDRVTFLLLGLFGAAALLFAFDGAWKWRFRGVRRPLVDAAHKRGA
ncbi:MAG: cytochrome C [Planctomycetota bacterium]|nr:MAG: cytochrome C [Planctomycetota bacterium]